MPATSRRPATAAADEPLPNPGVLLLELVDVLRELAAKTPTMQATVLESAMRASKAPRTWDGLQAYVQDLAQHEAWRDPALREEWNGLLRGAVTAATQVAAGGAPPAALHRLRGLASQVGRMIAAHAIEGRPLAFLDAAQASRAVLPALQRVSQVCIDTALRGIAWRTTSRAGGADAARSATASPETGAGRVSTPASDT